MRRIYESDALSRDDEDPFQPGEREQSVSPTASRTLPAQTLSRLLVPDWLLFRGLSVSVATTRSVYETDETVPIRISIENSLPFPVSVTAESSILWTWAVDGIERASHVEVGRDDPKVFDFGRSETKQFDRQWHQMFQTTDTEWTPAGPGEYTITAALNVPTPGKRGLRDETTIEIR